MSMVQLGLLLALAAPFFVAVWVAFLHWPRGTGRADGTPAASGECVVRGLTRARFAAETLDIEREVRNAVDDLASQHAVRLDMAVHQGSTVRIDPVILRTALRSLIDAAIRSATPGQVLITALTLGSQMHIRIVDDGADADQVSREIEAREPGELIALQGGSLAVEARPGQGTAVTIRLPIPGGAGPEADEFTETRTLAEQEV
jgi:hypothetical protein